MMGDHLQRWSSLRTILWSWYQRIASLYVKILQPTIAPQSACSQEVTSAIVEDQSLSIGGPVTGLSISHDLPAINISRSVGLLPELQRLRKTFIKLTCQSSLSGPPPPSDAETAK